MATNWAIISACHAPSRCPKLGITTVWFSHFAIKKNHRTSIQFMLSMRTIFNPADDLINSPYMTSRPREFREHQSHIFGPRFFLDKGLVGQGVPHICGINYSFACALGGGNMKLPPGMEQKSSDNLSDSVPKLPVHSTVEFPYNIFLKRWPM